MLAPFLIDCRFQGSHVQPISSTSAHGNPTRSILVGHLPAPSENDNVTSRKEKLVSSKRSCLAGEQLHPCYCLPEDLAPSYTAVSDSFSHLTSCTHITYILSRHGLLSLHRVPLVRSCERGSLLVLHQRISHPCRHRSRSGTLLLAHVPHHPYHYKPSTSAQQGHGAIGRLLTIAPDLCI